MRAWPEFVSFGEALTDMIRLGGDRWASVPGGAPWNVARVMASFGIPSAFGGAVSQDCFGEALWLASEAAQLDLRFMQRREKSPLLAIVHATHPPQYFFVGDDSADLHFQLDALPEDWEQDVRWAHFGGISLAREPLASRLVQLAEHLKAGGVKISYDPNFRAAMTEAYDPVLSRMTEIADLIKVSEEDLRGLFRTADEEAAFGRLLAMSPAAAFLYTRGSEGASLHVGSQIWRARPPQIEVVDTVGAGDCSLGGFLTSLMRTPEAGWSAHLRASVAAGAGACLSAGATPPTSDVVTQLAATVVVQGPL